MIDYRKVILQGLSLMVTTKRDAQFALAQPMAKVVLAMYADEFPEIDIPDEAKAQITAAKKEEEFLPRLARMWHDIEYLACEGEPTVVVDGDSAKYLLTLLVDSNAREDAQEYVRDQLLGGCDDG